MKNRCAFRSAHNGAADAAARAEKRSQCFRKRLAVADFVGTVGMRLRRQGHVLHDLFYRHIPSQNIP